MISLKTVFGAALVAAAPVAAALAQSAPLEVAAPVAAPATAPAAAPTAKTAQAAAADKDDEIICRRQAETGSLVKAKKTCHTRSQWAYIQQENKRMATDMVQNNMGRPTSN